LKISIITVCFNSAKTIRCAVDSVLSQSYKNIEYIVIDGCSSDKTLEVLGEYGENISTLVSERDSGIYDAMNKGLALASGDVIGFLNSDDFYADSSVLEQVSNAFRDESVDVCYADLVYVSQDNSQIVRYWKSEPFVKGSFTFGWCPAHPTFYMRKSVVDKYGCFDKSLKIAADVELMMRYLEVYEVRSIYIPFVWVRMRIGGETNKSLGNIIRQNKEIFNAFEKNSIKFSKMLFVVRKILNRTRQFVAGRLRKNS